MLSHDVLRDKFRGAILGGFLGDAFGAGFEGMGPDRTAFHLSHLSQKHPKYYTDDTDMTLALMESIIQTGGVDPENIAKQFRIHCDLTRGYAPGTIKVIEGLRGGREWSQVARMVFENGSFGNGAAMRVSPVGLFYHHDLDRVQEEAINQASVTHVHPLGQWGAVMQGVAVALALGEHPKLRLEKNKIVVRLREILWRGPIEYVRALNKIEEMLAQEKRRNAREVIRSLGNGVEAHFSVPSSVYIAVGYSPDFCDSVRAAVSLGGDTDTIAGMVGGIVGAHVGEKGLPADWIEQLEEGPRGRSYAADLADSLFETWLKVHKPS